MDCTAQTTKQLSRLDAAPAKGSKLMVDLGHLRGVGFLVAYITTKQPSPNGDLVQELKEFLQPRLVHDLEAHPDHEFLEEFGLWNVMWSTRRRSITSNPSGREHEDPLANATSPCSLGLENHLSDETADNSGLTMKFDCTTGKYDLSVPSGRRRTGAIPHKKLLQKALKQLKRLFLVLDEPELATVRITVFGQDVTMQIDLSPQATSRCNSGSWFFEGEHPRPKVCFSLEANVLKHVGAISRTGDGLVSGLKRKCDSGSIASGSIAASQDDAKMLEQDRREQDGQIYPMTSAQINSLGEGVDWDGVADPEIQAWLARL